MSLTKRTKLRPPKVKRKSRNTGRFEKEIGTSNIENVKELVIIVVIVLTREHDHQEWISCQMS